MASCGCDDGAVFDGAGAAYRRALYAVIAINGTMFLGETFAGYHAGSQALQADALDFLGDTFTYAISLWAVGQALATRARASLFKALTLVLMGAWVVGSTIHQALEGGTPAGEWITGVAAIALAANLASIVLLLSFRDGDANVRSVWLCSRNDAIGNFLVMIAGAGVLGTGSRWPDLAVAAVLASLFTSSAVSIFRQAMCELRQPHATAEGGVVWRS